MTEDVDRLDQGLTDGPEEAAQQVPDEYLRPALGQYMTPDEMERVNQPPRYTVEEAGRIVHNLAEVRNARLEMALVAIRIILDDYAGSADREHAKAIIDKALK